MSSRLPPILMTENKVAISAWGYIGSMFGRNGQTFDGFDLLCSVGVWVFMGVGDMAQAHAFHFLTPGTVMLELCLVG